MWNQTARQEFMINTRIAKANNAIALETKRESAQMRSIAVLTMVYLPMSCVAVSGARPLSRIPRSQSPFPNMGREKYTNVTY